MDNSDFMVVTKVKMREGRSISYNPLDIQGVYIDGVYKDRFDVYEFLVKTENKEKIYLAGSDSYLVPCVALNGACYLRSEPNADFTDNLLNLPRV